MIFNKKKLNVDVVKDGSLKNGEKVSINVKIMQLSFYDSLWSHSF